MHGYSHEMSTVRIRCLQLVSKHRRDNLFSFLNRFRKYQPTKKQPFLVASSLRQVVGIIKFVAGPEFSLYLNSIFEITLLNLNIQCLGTIR